MFKVLNDLQDTRFMEVIYSTNDEVRNGDENIRRPLNDLLHEARHTQGVQKVFIFIISSEAYAHQAS